MSSAARICAHSGYLRLVVELSLFRVTAISIHKIFWLISGDCGRSVSWWGRNSRSRSYGRDEKHDAGGNKCTTGASDDALIVFQAGRLAYTFFSLSHATSTL